MRPQEALSPRDRLRPGSLDVIYTERDGKWSLARMDWDGERRVGCRWNGEISDPNDKGNPRSHSQGTWFILPNEIGEPLARLVETFRQAYN
jgi:hypothetical protein